MKMAFSIPEDVFHKAGRAAKRLGLSRSQLYTLAIQVHLEAFEVTRVTKSLNRVYACRPSRLDPVLARMQSASIPRERW